MNATRNTSDRTVTARLIPALAAAAMIAGAAVPAHGAPKEADAFDPLGFPGDSIVVTDDVKPAGRRLSGSRASRLSDSTHTANAEIVLQVQFLATTNLTEAKDIKQRAETALKDSVRLDFETPYYKLRTGCFLSYDEAEALAVRLRAMGYESAWVVRLKEPPLTTPRVR